MTDPILVVIPTRNRPAMCAEAVASVLAQTDADWIAVVADDGDEVPVGSAPGWPDDPRIHVVRATTRTAGGARNAAIAYAFDRLPAPAPRLVAFLDDDDLWLPTHLEASRRALAANRGAVFCHGAAVTRDASGESPYHERESGPFDGRIFRALLRRDVVATSSAVARLDFVRAVGGFRADVRHAQDWDLWLKLAHRGPVAFVPETTVVYRSHGGNISRSLVSKIEDQIAVFAPWWARRHLLSCEERRILRREEARRRRRRVKRLLDEGRVPRREAIAAARRAFAEVPHPQTVRALVEAAVMPRGRGRESG